MPDRFTDITSEIPRRIDRAAQGGDLELEGVLPPGINLERRSVESMTWGNRVAYLPDEDSYGTVEAKAAACGLAVGQQDDDPLRHLVVQQAGRLPMVAPLAMLGKTVQLVGGHPSAYGFLRPAGVDEVWAINPRDDWPLEHKPDLIVTRDWAYLTGPSKEFPKAPMYGVNAMRRWPDVPVVVTADLGKWVAEATLTHERHCPEHFEGRTFYELALQNFFDTEFCDLAGFSIGAALALVRHTRARVVLTGVVCNRSDAEWAAIEKRMAGMKSVEQQKKEDAHIAHEVREWMNRVAGRCAWSHGPTVPGSIAPVWSV